MKDLLNQMIWIIPQEEENYFFEKRLGRRHKEGIDEYIKKRWLNVQATSEYDGLIKLAKLGCVTILNNGKTKDGYVGVCVIPETMSEKQKEFFNLTKEVFDNFSFFEISTLSDKGAVPINNTDMNDVDYLYDVYLNENSKNKSK